MLWPRDGEAWEEQGVKTGRRVEAGIRWVPGEEWEEPVEGFFGVEVWGFFFFNFMFSVEVFQVELTGFPDRTHSGSVLSTFQALMSEKSRGGRSTQNDL